MDFNSSRGLERYISLTLFGNPGKKQLKFYLEFQIIHSHNQIPTKSNRISIWQSCSIFGSSRDKQIKHKLIGIIYGYIIWIY